MRKALTRHEAGLWSWLKTLRGEGFHFRRQAPLRGYFLDFVCFSRSLVIEVDGQSHEADEQIAHDRTRDAVLRRQGFRVLRIWNGELDQDFDAVKQTIRAALAEPVPHPGARGAPAPPHKGEG
jgi:very-short-patch-repair endonuclease